MKTNVNSVNVAPSSTSGHFIEGAKQVINLDVSAETFFVKGESLLTTKNHTSLKQKDSSLITTQMVFNPFANVFEKAKD
jgi:hypothetical protein